MFGGGVLADSDEAVAMDRDGDVTTQKGGL
jgi:hypothetical protein